MKRLTLLFAVFALCFTHLSAYANQRLAELSKSNENWVLPGKSYNADNYSPMDQINTGNVKNLRTAWTSRPASCTAMKAHRW